MVTLRVVTHNVRSLRHDADAVARVLFRARPGRGVPPGGATVPALEAEPGAAGPALRSLVGGRRAADRRVGAVAGPRVSVVARREVLFTRSPDLHDRGATLARLRLAGGAEVTVASTHLGLDAAEYHGCRRSLLPLTYRMGRASGVRPGASTSRGAHEGSQGVLDMATFDVGGSWDAIQSNGHRASFALELRGDQGVFHGTASHSGGAVRGHGEGLITGSDFLYTVNWNNGTVGEYNGRFNAEGRITGVTFDKRNPASSATWSSSRRFRRI